ncbi:hypothetical protein [Shewanella sp. FJAT-52076]|uniref:hypothetical protein n=1 Tax=Shewanella sp. FJAT-52076 TaxID=2864202 RepID=UPI001C66208D|nr:hypothetical protein [Shewanella sp. FJAT-52076]QYJ75061.1 hypothetical protein K0H79_17235 [Shewanella sp. FJAT-52076]
MAINIVDVEEVLRQQPYSLTLMKLHVLDPTRDPYRAVLLQPPGLVEANSTRVGHANADVGYALCREFLSIAANNYSDLAVAPEYCVPWSVVDQIVNGGLRPPHGAIWVLGCESISPIDFLERARHYNATGSCLFHHKPIDGRQAAQRSYVDPLLYIFWTENQDGQPVLFLLAQLKTVPCRDYRDVEQTSLCLGDTIYAFNRDINSIGLVSIICSDAFNFTEHIDRIHNNCLLIHIQLNPKPAHADYAAYRKRLCSVGSNSNVELLCVNWAKSIKENKGGGRQMDWNNVAGSAWYAPPAKFGTDDGLIDALHRKGLYYCLLEKRWHSFFLNYEGQIIQLQKQKLFFLGEQALAPKNFIGVEGRWSWDPNNNSWEPGAIANDGFSEALGGYQAISEHLHLASQASPLAVERAIELLMGPQGTPNSWYVVKELDAIHLDRDEESIRRLTVHQDPDTSRPGSSYRFQRLQRAQDAISLIQCDVPWPPPVQDLANGFKFSWTSNAPHYNVQPNTGGRGPAALVYLSDQANDATIISTYKKLNMVITTHAAAKACTEGKFGEELQDAIVRAQDRICVVFRRDGRFGVRRPEGTNQIDTPANSSSVDFTEDRS